MNKHATTLAAVAILAAAPSALATIVTVYSNSGGSGDTYTNATGTNQGQAVTNNANVFYNNTRNSGSVGINSTYARSGNGSAFLGGTVGPGGSSSKSDIEVLSSGTNFGGNYLATTAFGTLSQLTSLEYDWYRDSSSTNDVLQHPVVRILIDADGNLNTTGDRGGLVFERAYNGGGAVPTNTWVTEDVLSGYNAGDGAYLWTFGAGMSFAQLGYGLDFSDWAAGAGTISGSSAILGFSMGAGSGWGPFSGAVDNLTIGLNGVETTYNFEVLNVVPMPQPIAMAAAGFLGVALVSRRRVIR